MIALRRLAKKSVATDLLDFSIIPPIYIRGSTIRCEKMNIETLRGLTSFVKHDAAMNSLMFSFLNYNVPLRRPFRPSSQSLMNFK